MKALLLAFLLWQAIPQREGVVTGVVRGANGMPAAGVRVYAIGVREGLTVLDSAAPLEGLTQTDASGRYRLEISPGRYYIGSGAVSSPTFYPGARDIAGARVVTVASGGFVEAIDFSSFVPAPAAGVRTVVAQGTGVLSGTIRFHDGSPATGIPLSIVPASGLQGRLAPTAPVQVQPAPVSGNIVLQFLSVNTPNGPPAPPQIAYFQGQAVYSATRRSIFSDNSGRYVFSSLPSDTYYIAAGYAESPTLFPGVTDIALAKSVVTTPTTNMSSLDFTLPRPPASVKVSGRVTAIAGTPAGGTSVELRTTSSSPSAYGLPSRNPMVRAFAGPDGSFEFPGVFPGTYLLEAFIGGVRAESRNVVVSDQPLTGLDLSIRVAVLSGRIVAEDGSTLPDPRVFADAILSSVGNPNMITSTILPIGRDGSFSRVLELGEYRFYLRTLPEEYSIKSIIAGDVDLMKETLRFNGREPVNVEIRVAKRTLSADPGAVRVQGRAVDALSGVPSAAARITLCCRDSGFNERFSAPLNADGSFEFSAIPPGHYAVGLEVSAGSPNAFIVGRDIDVGSQGRAELQLFSTPQFGELVARLVLEGGGVLPENSTVAVAFKSATGRVEVISRQARDGIYSAALPVGDRYTVSVIGLPDGYVVKSITGSTEVRPAYNPPIGAPPLPTPIVITLAPAPR